MNTGVGWTGLHTFTDDAGTSRNAHRDDMAPVYLVDDKHPRSLSAERAERERHAW